MNKSFTGFYRTGEVSGRFLGVPDPELCGGDVTFLWPRMAD